MILAIDGTAASGKGTLAKRLASHFGLPHLDTGLLYRAVGRRLLDSGRSPDDAAEAERLARMFQISWLVDERLRTGEAGMAASRVAVIPGVRAALLDFQRAFAATPGGAVLDGRDIGTVIAPHADVKIWVTAKPEVRAHRRFLELYGQGRAVDEPTVLRDLLARDANDAPNMIRAADALLLDTTDMDKEAVFREAIAMVQGWAPGHGVTQRTAG
jgi:cytidylate kinase